jgi:hypothetical protein
MATTTTPLPSTALSSVKALMNQHSLPQAALATLFLIFTNFLQQINEFALPYSTIKILKSLNSIFKDQKLVETRTYLQDDIFSSSSNENWNFCDVSGSVLHEFHLQIWFAIIVVSLLGMGVGLLFLTKMCLQDIALFAPVIIILVLDGAVLRLVSERLEPHDPPLPLPPDGIFQPKPVPQEPPVNPPATDDDNSSDGKFNMFKLLPLLSACQMLVEGLIKCPLLFSFL